MKAKMKNQTKASLFLFLSIVLCSGTSLIDKFIIDIPSWLWIVIIAFAFISLSMWVYYYFRKVKYHVTQPDHIKS